MERIEINQRNANNARLFIDFLKGRISRQELMEGIGSENANSI